MGMPSRESWLGVGAGSSLQVANRHLHSGAVRNLCKGKSTQIKSVNTVSIGIECTVISNITYMKFAGVQHSLLDSFTVVCCQAKYVG